mgnify:CR=1 FL=1
MVEVFGVHSKTVNPVVDTTTCIWVLYSFSNYKLATGWEYGLGFLWIYHLQDVFPEKTTSF